MFTSLVMMLISPRPVYAQIHQVMQIKYVQLCSTYFFMQLDCHDTVARKFCCFEISLVLYGLVLSSLLLWFKVGIWGK